MREKNFDSSENKREVFFSELSIEILYLISTVPSMKYISFSTLKKSIEASEIEFMMFEMLDEL